MESVSQTHTIFTLHTQQNVYFIYKYN